MKVHNSGNLVAWDAKLKEKPNILVLLHYQSDEEVRKQTMLYTCMRLVLPMKVHVSPTLIALTHDQVKPWRPRWTDSVTSIIQLQDVLRCYTTVPSIVFYENHSKLCDTVFNHMKAQTDKMEEELLKHLGDDDFKKRIRDHTISYINMLEKCLMKLFNVNLVVTPSLDPGTITLDDDTIFKEHFKLFFRSKDNMANTKFFTFKESIYDNYRSFLEYELKK